MCFYNFFSLFFSVLLSLFSRFFFNSAAKNSSTDLMFNMVVLRENYHQMSDMLVLADELGIKYLNIIPMNIVSRTDLDISYYQFFQSEEFKKGYFKTKALAKKYSNVELTFYDFESPASFKKCRFMWNYFYNGILVK